MCFYLSFLKIFTTYFLFFFETSKNLIKGFNSHLIHYPSLVQWLERSAVDILMMCRYDFNDLRSAVTERSPVQIREGGLLFLFFLMIFLYYKGGLGENLGL